MTAKTFTIRALIASVLAFGLAFGLSALVSPAGAAESPAEIHQDDEGCYTLSYTPESRWSQTTEATEQVGYTEYKYKKWTAAVPGVREYKHVKVTPAVEGVKEYEWTRTLKAQKQVLLPSAQHDSKKNGNGHSSDFEWQGTWYHPDGNNWQKWVNVPDSLQPPHYGDVGQSGTFGTGSKPYGLPSGYSIQWKYLVFTPEYQTSTTEPAGSGWTKTGEWSWAVEPKPEVKTYAWGARYTFSREWSETGKWRWVSKPVAGYWTKTGWTTDTLDAPWIKVRERFIVVAEAEEAFTVYYVSGGEPTLTLTDANWTTDTPEGWDFVDTREREDRTAVECVTESEPPGDPEPTPTPEPESPVKQAPPAKRATAEPSFTG